MSGGGIVFKWRLIPDVIYGSKRYTDRWYQCRYDFIVVDGVPGGTLDVDHLREKAGDSFSPLNWKSVEHWKVEGTWVVNDTSSQPNRSPAQPIQPGQNAAHGGWTHPDESELVFVEVGDSAQLYTWNSKDSLSYSCVTTELDQNGVVWVNWYACSIRRSGTKWRRERAMSSGDWKYPSPSALEEDWHSLIPSHQGWIRRATNRVTIDKQYSTGVSPQSLPTQSQLLRRVGAGVSTIVGASNTVLSSQLEGLHARAFDGLQAFDGNLLLLAGKLQSAIGSQTVRSLVDFARDPLSVGSAASYWLSTQYGDKLSVSGLASLIKSIDKAFLTVPSAGHRPYILGKSRASGSTVVDLIPISWSCATNLALKPKDYNTLMRLIRNLMSWDAYLTLQNVWDAIPLSFVVDWFVNVGDILNSIDRMVAARYYDVAATLNSVKSTSSSPLTPGLSYTYYYRFVGSELHLGVDSPKVGLPGLVNCISGVSLLLG
jgi:hypothetical protein